MPTFNIPLAYVASGVVVADGVMSLSTPYLLTSATAAFSQRMQGIAISVAGAGAAAAALTTRIEEVISTTKVRLKDPALTVVAAANLTYAIGRIRLYNLLRVGDIASNTYNQLYASRIQLQVNSLSPGKIYVGNENVSPTNAGAELVAPGDADESIMGDSFGGWVCADTANSLLNIQWTDL